MMTKVRKISVIVLLLISAGIVLEWSVRTHVLSTYGNRLVAVTIDGRTFRSELVANDEKMQKGLGGRDDLCADCGMLFQFSRPGDYSFWMKDMHFPLDIIWISNGKIVHIEKNASEKNPTQVMNPNVSADSVLEINAGKADELRIQEGDDVTIAK